MKILREDAGVALLDADDALGAVSCSHAMELCMEKASRTGCASVAVTHSNHIGFLAYYTMMAAKRNMIGIAVCNSGSSTLCGEQERGCLVLILQHRRTCQKAFSSDSGLRYQRGGSRQGFRGGNREQADSWELGL